VPEQPSQDKTAGFFVQIRQIVFWPLRKLLSYSLENPALLQHGTRFVSRFPLLFNWLVGFAQAHGIVMAAEEPDPDLDEIQSVSELSSEARILYESLRVAFRDRSETKY
jgi:hypothetical protein